MCSVLAYRLFTEADTLGALNLCSRERDAFDDEAEADRTRRSICCGG